MNLQIFGTRKCHDTRKAEMFFKERRISYQFIDLAEKGMSAGELKNIQRSVPLEALIDTEGKEYERRNLKYLRFDKEKTLLNYPLLLKTPVVRDGNRATVGYCPDVWKGWMNASQK
ncbi:MAG: ArsC family transcriptional regulator [Candidatus Latescibacteria bacterium]|nr:ArsC family transcriptional regulator [Candidatus Latescibacterota bacterium]